MEHDDIELFSYVNPTYDFMEGRSCHATAAIAKMIASSSPSLFFLKMPFICDFPSWFFVNIMKNALDVVM